MRDFENNYGDGYPPGYGGPDPFEEDRMDNYPFEEEENEEYEEAY